MPYMDPMGIYKFLAETMIFIKSMKLAEAPSCRRFGMTTEKPLQPRLKIEVNGWERGWGMLKYKYIYI